MTSSPLRTACAVLLLCLFAIPANAAGPVAPPSPVNFVQTFYDWYVPLEDDAIDRTLKEKQKAFDAPLLQGLRKDRAAKRKAVGDLVGLEFDPFLNSQDPWDRYEAGRATAQGGQYRVEIFGVNGGKRNKTPDVIAELAAKNGSWVFVNFHYPKNGDLKSILRSLEAEYH